MQTSEQINEIATALAKAQGSISGAAKDSTNPHFKSKYADLASCWDACRAPLSTNGLSVVQSPSQADGEVMLTTLLMHASGQWMRSEVAVRPGKPDAQGLGSALTYLRRYALCAMVGIAPDDDDDGNAAVDKDQSGTGRKRPENGNGNRAYLPQVNEAKAWPGLWEEPSYELPMPDGYTARDLIDALVTQGGTAPTLDHVNKFQADNEGFLEKLREKRPDAYYHINTILNARRSHFLNEPLDQKEAAA